MTPQILLSLLLGASGALLQNADFSKGLEGWSQGGAAEVVFETVAGEDRPAVAIRVGESAEVGWPSIAQHFAVKPGELVRGEVDARGLDTRKGHGAYLAVEFIGADGKRISHEQTEMAPRSGEWTRLKLLGIAPEGTASGRFCLLLHGRGEARFARAALSTEPGPQSKPLDGPVTLTVTENVACDSLIGFGAEDDGWFYNEENKTRGVTEEDWAVREGRIDWMAPDWVRMFFWYRDWNPSGDWKTFDFDTDNMRSHYRTLDQYQRLGARVNVTGVEWGVRDPYGNPEKAARAIGALMAHIVREKGYTCVTDWTLSNEPNGYFLGAGYDFDRFREMHVRVRGEFDRLGLDIRIAGSDDTGSFNFFSQCVNDDAYFGLSDYFASHRYIQAASRRMMSVFLDERLELLAAKTPRKPFVVAEFGFQDSRSGTLENPIMESYDYALWTAAFVIEGLNKGVAGFSVWCLHEVYYPGNGFMNYGLWNYKTDHWRVRPVYHAWSAFSRLTKQGDTVRRCDSTHPGHVSGAYAGDTLFWVNESDQAVEVRVQGAQPREVRIMTEDSLAGDRECGAVAPLEEGRFTAPPKSFGYAMS
ncbi:MAG: hypothetical protein H3C30_16630 [Candidatus Hydrogenedentes bacterium]|nr:hypothetical protein [Candidatus Hydrogenedentota bacterium]